MRGAWAVAGLLAAIAPPALAQPIAAATIARDAYRLGPGDKLRVTTFGEESLSGAFEVSGTGVVAFPLIGEVKAQGRTLGEFEAAVTAALRDGYLKDPKVSAEVNNYRPFYILGEVGKPGVYPYAAGLTVMNAVATANGFTYRANTRSVRIRHAGDAAEQDVRLDAATPVSPGDTIRVRERHF